MTPSDEAKKKLDNIRARLEKRIAGERLDFWYKSVHSKQNPMGPYGWQVDFHNAGNENIQRAIIAGNQCVTASQLIDMADGSKKRADLVVVGDAVASWDESSFRVVPGIVSALVRKPAEPIVRIRILSDGVESSLETVSRHRILGNQGWSRVSTWLSDISCGHNTPKARGVDAPHCSPSGLNSRFGYPFDRGFGDGPPLRGLGVDPDDFPLSSGVPTHSHVWWPVGGWACVDIGSLLSPPNLLSTGGVFGRFLHRLAASLFPSPCISGLPSPCVYPKQNPHPQVAYHHPEPFSSVSRGRSQFLRPSLISSYGGRIDIESFEWLPPQPLYDFTVEVYHNYISSGGLVNHNTGKSRTAAAEIAIHASGLYPKWWKGRRFNKPIVAWIGSNTNEESRNVAQKHLLGGTGEDLGTGLIPARCLVGQKPRMRQCGVSNVVESIKVKHESGGCSEIFWKTYDQGRARWQGAIVDIVWFDEEPPADVYSEGFTRTITKGGMTMLTFTPLSGMGDVVYKFWNADKYDGIYTVNAPWSAAPHLTEEKKKALISGYQEYEIDARTEGIPIGGASTIFPFKNDTLMVEPFEIPKHYKRICGIDFGINHPAAAAWLAIDADSGMVYVTDCYRQSGEGSAYHASRINAHKDSAWIPVAWPHDGMNREKSGGKTLADHYRDAGVKTMMYLSARFDDDSGGSQSLEDGVMNMYDLMRSGQFKVFNHLHDWFEEKNMYHRDDRNKIVPTRDDIMSATRYAVMMRRYAISSVQADLLHSPLTQTADVEYDPTNSYD